MECDFRSLADQPGRPEVRIVYTRLMPSSRRHRSREALSSAAGHGSSSRTARRRPRVRYSRAIASWAYQGPVLVRGQRLDAAGPVTFGEGPQFGFLADSAVVGDTQSA